jgi:sulfonate transport system ATP-binding protein
MTQLTTLGPEHVTGPPDGFTPSANGRESVVVSDGVRVTFPSRNGAVEAVHDASFAVHFGELCCVVGPSGCGKSTLLHVIAGLLKPAEGQMLVEGRRVNGPNVAVAYMTQRDTLLPWASALDNVALPIRAVGKRDRSLAQELLELVGLAGFERHYPHELSGGMRKRVQLARALAQEPRILLMDEPFSALDAQTKLVIEAEFLRIWEQRQVTVVFVTHDLAEAINMADRIVLLSHRPSVVKEDHTIALPRPRKANGVHTDPDYQVFYRRLWTSLEEEIVAANNLGPRAE